MVGCLVGRRALNRWRTCWSLFTNATESFTIYAPFTWNNLALFLSVFLLSLLSKSTRVQDCQQMSIASHCIPLYHGARQDSMGCPIKSCQSIMPYCTMGQHEISHRVPCAIPSVHPIPVLYHGKGWDGMGCPTESHVLFLTQSQVSILSHCTMGRDGMAWDVPESPMCYACAMPKSQVFIPPHCTMGRDGTGWHGMSHRVPRAVPQSQVSILSHCTLGWDQTVWEAYLNEDIIWMAVKCYVNN